MAYNYRWSMWWDFVWDYNVTPHRIKGITIEINHPRLEGELEFHKIEDIEDKKGSVEAWVDNYYLKLEDDLKSGRVSLLEKYKDKIKRGNGHAKVCNHGRYCTCQRRR
jgi:hypothetical protein